MTPRVNPVRRFYVGALDLYLDMACDDPFVCGANRGDTGSVVFASDYDAVVAERDRARQYHEAELADARAERDHATAALQSSMARDAGRVIVAEGIADERSRVEVYLNALRFSASNELGPFLGHRVRVVVERID